MLFKRENIQNFYEKIGETGRLIGIDYGKKFLGVAISDSTRLIATSLNLVELKKIDQLNRLIHDNQIKAVVIGYPLELSGNAGESCKIVEDFAKKMVKHTELPVYLQDERFSTAAAKRVLDFTKLTRKKKNIEDNKISACIILQKFLDLYHSQKTAGF